MALIITFEDKTYTFDRSKIDVTEWRELKRKYGITPRGFEDGIKEADPDVMTFLYWLLRKRDGDVHLTLGDHLKPDIIALHAAIADAVTEEPPAEEAEPDPTQDGSLPVTSTPISNGSSKATSATSATSISSSSPVSATSVPGTSMN